MYGTFAAQVWKQDFCSKAFTSSAKEIIYSAGCHYRLLNGRKYLVMLYKYGDSEIQERRIIWTYCSSNASGPVALMHRNQGCKAMHMHRLQPSTFPPWHLDSANQVSQRILYIAAPTTSLSSAYECDWSVQLWKKDASLNLIWSISCSSQRCLDQTPVCSCVHLSSVPIRCLIYIQILLLTSF